MDERDALKKMICKDEDALAWFIDRYAPYVSTIIYNILGSFVDSSDLEEVASDVFLTLWNNAKSVNPGKVKAYLGGIARNKAKEYTRKIGTELSLEDDIIIISDENLEHDFEKREQAKYIQEAVLALNAPEREIFLRYYFFLSADCDYCNRDEFGTRKRENEALSGAEKIEGNIRKRRVYC